jgi:D-alanyl-lipoteichoic acid acyltransferase DltB (MBOAT superfamily)
MKMDSASFAFVAFGLVVAIVTNCNHSRVWRSAVLLVASFVSLGLLFPQPLLLLPLLGFLILGYGTLLLMNRGWHKSIGWSVLAIVMAYVWLKKYTFIPAGSFLPFSYRTLGLSYIFFRVLHLVVDASASDEKKHIGLGPYLLYTLNFTTLISGPIQRYEDFAADQFAETPIPLDGRTIALQLERIVRGFFKVNVLAMLLDIFRTDALAQLTQPLPAAVRVFGAFRLVLVYPLFLYCNFSGYIDIVIGLARLMRLRLPENFDRPFSAASVMEFWTRWHITLSKWLKMYVYNPLLLALMRRLPSLKLQSYLGVLCFFVTFFLIGIWHGRTSEFVVFGLLTGAGISVNKLWQLSLLRHMGRKAYKDLGENHFYRAFGRGLNFVWFSFTLIWFWADWQHIARIFLSLTAAEWFGVWTAACVFATAVLAFWELLRDALLSIGSTDGPLLLNRYARVIYASSFVLVAFVVTILLNQPAPGIIYKAF